MWKAQNMLNLKTLQEWVFLGKNENSNQQE